MKTAAKVPNGGLVMVVCVASICVSLYALCSHFRPCDVLIGIFLSFPISFPLSSGTGKRFLSWVQLRRRKRLDKMATNAHKVFHEFSVTKLGNPNLELKKEQYDVIRTICLEKRDVLTVLPTGVGKSLCYQAFPAIFDFYGK